MEHFDIVSFLTSFHPLQLLDQDARLSKSAFHAGASWNDLKRVAGPFLQPSPAETVAHSSMRRVPIWSSARIVSTLELPEIPKAATGSFPGPKMGAATQHRPSAHSSRSKAKPLLRISPSSLQRICLSSLAYSTLESCSMRTVRSRGRKARILFPSAVLSQLKYPPGGGLILTCSGPLDVPVDEVACLKNGQVYSLSKLHADAAHRQPCEAPQVGTQPSSPKLA